MSTSVGSTMEGRRSQSYETERNMADKGSSRTHHHLDSSPHSRTVVLEGGREQVIQFHGMLEDAILRESLRNTPGLKVALHLFEGYFGYFGEK